MKTQNKPQNDETTLKKEERAFKLRIKGWSQERIAKNLNMTQQGVSKALKRITKRFSKQFLGDVTHIKNEQIAQLENSAHEAMTAWYKSKEKHKIKKTKVKGSKEGAQAAEKLDEERDQYGDPRYLSEFRKAKEDIRKIYGEGFFESVESEEPITEIKINIIGPDESLDEN